MSDGALFDLRDFAKVPPWADACFYCAPDPDTGEYVSEALHLSEHLPITCSVCGDTEPNRLLFEMNHSSDGDRLRGIWGPAARCTSLWLRLNHLTYAVRHGNRPQERDLSALELGWRIAPDGTQISPDGRCM